MKRIGMRAAWQVAALTLFLTPSLAAYRLPSRATTLAWNPNYRFCFRDVINTPDTWLTPPTIDGVVAGDNGWTSAWKYVFNNGTTSPDVTVQGIKDAANLYLSFEVNNDTQWDNDDVIVIAFSPTGVAGDERMLQIFPVVPSGAAVPVTVQYWLGSPWSGLGGAAPAGTTVVATASGPMGNRSWFVEVKIPRAAFAIPAAGDFGFYFNVIPVNGPTMGPFGTAHQYPWPTEMTNLIGLDLVTDIPASTNWGNATVGAVTCNGVSISGSDIFTNNSPPNLIATNAPNTFNAVAHNNTINGAGTPVAASNIFATFKIARFGLSNMWSLVPATGGTTNPTATTTIPANSTSTFSLSWTLSPAQVTEYSSPYDHQCILVELGSTAAPASMTVFANKSAWTNMDFGTASEYTSKATIDGRGWGRLIAGQAKATFDLVTTRSDTFLQPGREPQTAVVAPPQPVSQVTYLVHGCLHTGRQITIRKTRYDICQRIGSYGYVVRHAAASPASWTVRFGGPGLSRPMGQGKNVYRLAVAPDSMVELAAAFVAQEGGTGPGGGGKPGICSRFTLFGTSSLAGGLALIGFATRRRRARWDD